MPGMFGSMNWAPFTGFPAPGSIGRNLLQQNPDDTYRVWANLGAREDPFARWLRSQSTNTYSAYLGAASQQPNLDYVDYLSGHVNDILKGWGGLSPLEAGYRTPYGPGRTHFSGF